MGIKIQSKVGMVLGLMLLIAGIYTMGRLTSLGAFYQIEIADENPALVIAEVPGPEDLEINIKDSVLYFISSNPCSKSPAPGSIHYVLLNRSPVEFHAFQFNKPLDLHPHGLSYFRSDDKRYLFTNNHRSDGTHSVEIFSIVEQGKLVHLESITGPLLTSPNDLVAIGARSFYVTNDGRAHDRFTRSVDTFLGRNTGSVLLFDENRFTTVVDNLSFPNGIALNINENQIMVAETLSGYVNNYQMVDNQVLKYVDNFYIGVGVDNISLDDYGNLTAAIHQNLWALSRHMKDPKRRSPSRVVQYNLNSRLPKVLYQQQGSQISGVSAAVNFNGSLYLGAVCEPKLLKVEMTNDK